MRAVSINDFIDEVFKHDSEPPAVSTVRRLCGEQDEEGQPVIPGAFRFGKAWKIDLEHYYKEMERRLAGENDTPPLPPSGDESFLESLAKELATPN